MPEPLIRREDIGPVARLTLNAPGSLNALSQAMLVALEEALARLAEDPTIRVVVLGGAGKAFSVGHDLKEIQAARAAPDHGRGYFAALFERCDAVMQAISALPQPVIASVQGVATAAGCQLVASCDLAVAARDTRFGVNGINVGLFCSTPMVALTRAVPARAAFEMLTTGEFINAARAFDLGLVNRVVEPAALARETLALAELIASKPAAAIRAGKRAFQAQAGMGLAEAYDHCAAVMVENVLWDDTDEGIAAFLAKRAPDWRG